MQAHRFAYERAVGPIPPGKVVCHTCDNPPCVRPAHLWVGTRAENQQDMARKGRARRGDVRGEANGRAKLTRDQVEDIRRSTESGPVLGARFGITRARVNQIKRGEGWQ